MIYGFRFFRGRGYARCVRDCSIDKPFYDNYFFLIFLLILVMFYLFTSSAIQCQNHRGQSRPIKTVSIR